MEEKIIDEGQEIVNEAIVPTIKPALKDFFTKLGEDTKATEEFFDNKAKERLSEEPDLEDVDSFGSSGPTPSKEESHKPRNADFAKAVYKGYEVSFKSTNKNQDAGQILADVIEYLTTVPDDQLPFVAGQFNALSDEEKFKLWKKYKK